MAKEHRFRAGARTGGISANVAGAELDRLNKKHNGLTPECVLDSAKAKTSPLHPVFEWDDSKAGREYRLDQARKLIRNVYTVRPDDTIEHMFIHTHMAGDGDGAGGVYRPIADIVADVDLYKNAWSLLHGKVLSAVHSLEELAVYPTGLSVVDRLRR